MSAKYFLQRSRRKNILCCARCIDYKCPIHDPRRNRYDVDPGSSNRAGAHSIDDLDFFRRSATSSCVCFLTSLSPSLLSLWLHSCTLSEPPISKRISFKMASLGLRRFAAAPKVCIYNRRRQPFREASCTSSDAQDFTLSILRSRQGCSQ